MEDSSPSCQTGCLALTLTWLNGADLDLAERLLAVQLDGPEAVNLDATPRVRLSVSTRRRSRLDGFLDVCGIAVCVIGKVVHGMAEISHCDVLNGRFVGCLPHNDHGTPPGMACDRC